MNVAVPPSGEPGIPRYRIATGTGVFGKYDGQFASMSPLKSGSTDSFTPFSGYEDKAGKENTHQSFPPADRGNANGGPSHGIFQSVGLLHFRGNRFEEREDISEKEGERGPFPEGNIKQWDPIIVREGSIALDVPETGLPKYPSISKSCVPRMLSLLNARLEDALKTQAIPNVKAKQPAVP